MAVSRIVLPVINRLYLTFVASTLLLMAGCLGGDGKRQAPDNSLDTTPQAIPTATEVLARALLAPSDLGGGWASSSVEGATLADDYYCGTKVESFPTDAIAILINEALGYTMFEFISEFEDVAAARSALNAERDAHRGCDELLSTDGVSRTEWRTRSLADIDAGDEALSFLARSDIGEGYFTIIRDDEIVIGVVIIHPEEVDVAEAEELGRTAHRKVARFMSER